MLAARVCPTCLRLARLHGHKGEHLVVTWKGINVKEAAENSVGVMAGVSVSSFSPVYE